SGADSDSRVPRRVGYRRRSRFHAGQCMGTSDAGWVLLADWGAGRGWLCRRQEGGARGSGRLPEPSGSPGGGERQMRGTVHESRTTSVQQGIEPRRYFPDTTVDVTDGRRTPEHMGYRVQPGFYFTPLVSVKSAIHTVPVRSPRSKRIAFEAARFFARNS